jgi:hypothetical protein
MEPALESREIKMSHVPAPWFYQSRLKELIDYQQQQLLYICVYWNIQSDRKFYVKALGVKQDSQQFSFLFALLEGKRLFHKNVITKKQRLIFYIKLAPTEYDKMAASNSPPSAVICWHSSVLQTFESCAAGSWSAICIVSTLGSSFICRSYELILFFMWTISYEALRQLRLVRCSWGIVLCFNTCKYQFIIDCFLLFVSCSGVLKGGLGGSNLHPPPPPTPQNS